MHRNTLKGTESDTKRASQIPILAKSPLRIRKLLSLPVLLIAGACSAASVDLVEAGRVAMKIADDNAWYIRQVGVYEDEKGVIIRGAVRPGNRSHMPKLYTGHIDVLIKSPEGDRTRVETVDLRGRQSYFSYRLRSPVAENARFTIAYSKTSHSRHAKVLLGGEATPDLRPESPIPAQDNWS